MVRESKDPRDSQRDLAGAIEELPDLEPARKPKRERNASGERVLKKQISLFVPLETWKAVRRYAADCQLSMTDVMLGLSERGGLMELLEGGDPLRARRRDAA